MKKSTLASLIAPLFAFSAVSLASSKNITVERSFHRDGVTVAKEYHYKDGVLFESRIFNSSGEQTVLNEWELLKNGHWIRQKIDLETGKVESKVELRLNEGTSVEEAGTMNSFTVKEWKLSDDPDKKPTTVDVFKVDPRLPDSKLILDRHENVQSEIRYFYEEGGDRPHAFEEIVEGKIVTRFTKYEPFTPLKTWDKAGLSEEEKNKRLENLNKKEKFLLAVIDSGFDYNHVDLAHHWYMNPKDPMDGIDNDGKG